MHCPSRGHFYQHFAGSVGSFTNNIRCHGAKALGNMLRKTCSLKRLKLEWNAIGAWENGIDGLVSGLVCNKTLEMLDLRNNQINSRGGGVIADSLQTNTSLKSLDLRWNNLGELGGRALLAALDNNTTITSLLVDGNHIPHDILAAINAKVQRNAGTALVQFQDQQRIDFLNRELDHINNSTSDRIKQLQDTIAAQMRENQQQQLAYKEQLNSLQAQLSARDEQAQHAAKQMNISARAKGLVEEELADANTLIVRLREQLEQARSEHDALRQNLSKNHEDALNRKAEELENLQQKFNQVFIQLGQEQLAKELLQRQYDAMKSEVTRLDLKLSSLTETHQAELQRQADYFQKTQAAREESVGKDREELIQSHQRAETKWAEAAHDMELKHQAAVKELHQAKDVHSQECVKLTQELTEKHAKETQNLKEEQRKADNIWNERWEKAMREKETLLADLNDAKTRNLQLTHQCEKEAKENSQHQSQLAEQKKESTQQQTNCEQKLQKLEAKIAAAVEAEKEYERQKISFEHKIEALQLKLKAAEDDATATKAALTKSQTDLQQQLETKQKQLDRARKSGLLRAAALETMMTNHIKDLRDDHTRE
eukprot:m.209465 g.209465  ORF g.209465 m.209465 type:complete len:599 (-) comp26105_c0_seq4:94-1890(-)